MKAQGQPRDSSRVTSAEAAPGITAVTCHTKCRLLGENQDRSLVFSPGCRVKIKEEFKSRRGELPECDCST